MRKFGSNKELHRGLARIGFEPLDSTLDPGPRLFMPADRNDTLAGTSAGSFAGVDYEPAGI